MRVQLTHQLSAWNFPLARNGLTFFNRLVYDVDNGRKAFLFLKRKIMIIFQGGSIMNSSNRLWMKILLLILIPLLFVPSLRSESQELTQEIVKAKESLRGEALLSHIEFLASSFCRGRETGEKGMDLAETYITTILKGAEVKPAGEYNSFYQAVRLSSLDLGEPLKLQIDDASGCTTATLAWDFLPLELSAEKRVSGQLVFAGYGITAPEHHYDDYKQIDARGKVVLVLRHEPQINDENSLFEGTKSSKYAPYLAKIHNAQKHGAVGIIFFNGPLGTQDSDLANGYTSGAYWPSLEKEKFKEEEDYRFFSFTSSMNLTDLNLGITIPAVVVSGTFAQALVGPQKNLETIQKQIDDTLIPQSFAMNQKAILDVHFKHKPIKARNIAFKVEGCDPKLKDETIIICAHYDHVGKDARGRVFGGADDNASGTSAVMEIAKAFKACSDRPKRTLLFLLFTAEEKGLLGSRFYCQHPLVPLEKTLAVINLDMLGRNDINQMGLLGKYQYPKLFQVIDEINTHGIHFEFNFTVETFLGNSDHFPFMAHGIPSLFLNSGNHEQLHRPEDTPDRILPEKVEKAAKLVLETAWTLANLPAGSQLK